MINQFKFKFTYNMYQALQAHMSIPIRHVPFDKGKEKGKSGDDRKRWEEYQDVKREVYRHFEEGALGKFKGKGKDSKASTTLNIIQNN